MSLKKRLAAVAVLVIAASLTFGVAKSGRQISEKRKEAEVVSDRETLYLWYTDEALTSYLSSAAVAYNEEHEIRVVPVLETGLEYLEKINQSSLESDVPDMYILGHDSLEKAYLAGLASEVKSGDMKMEDAYMGTALQAVTYKDKLIGYPFYFETSALLYNKTYLRDMAQSRLEAEEVQAEEADAKQEEKAQSGDVDTQQSSEGQSTEADAPQSSEGQGAETDTQQGSEAQDTESRFSEEQIAAKMQEILPDTIEDIKSFANNYDAPRQVEGVFKWDVTDIFYNYFFVGAAMNMGGEAGWDTEQIDIYNENAIRSMQEYQEMSQFFSIDTSEISYEGVLDEFMAGKMVFTVATTDAVFALEHAAADGLFEYEYGIAMTPSINDERQTRPLSMTSCVVINGYSAKAEEANEFAKYLTTEYNQILYARTGKVSAAVDVDYGYEALEQFAAEYEKSISMPKMIETSNFWVQLEVAFSEIWNGADANEKLKELSEQMKSQITGEAVEEEYIEIAEDEADDVEYSE